MDCRRALAPLLILTCVGAGEELPIREARWIAPEARVEQLTTIVAPCIADFSGNPLPGAVAFEDPLLLGGQAARAGLSCASCHRGARGNPAFVFPSVSGAPGTADITASLLSSHRGDGIFNPRPIPDLTRDAPKVSRTAPGVLEAFIRGLIVEEFDGPEPPPRLLASLAGFVRALDPKACKPPRARDALYDIARYGMALDQAIAAIDAGDDALALTMLRAARSRLGVIAERFAPMGESQVSRQLEDASDAIKRAQDALGTESQTPTIRSDLTRHRQNLVVWADPILRDEPQSLYVQAHLTAAGLAEPLRRN